MAIVDSARLTDTETQQIPNLLLDRVDGVLAIYLFGSHASGEARADSDVDIGVLARDALSPMQRLGLMEALGAQLQRDVDLVDLRTASAVLRSQVVARGTPLYRSDDHDVERFEDFVYADYARLNEERAGILEDVRSRGRIYGG